MDVEQSPDVGETLLLRLLAWARERAVLAISPPFNPAAPRCHRGASNGPVSAEAALARSERDLRENMQAVQLSGLQPLSSHTLRYLHGRTAEEYSRHRLQLSAREVQRRACSFASDFRRDPAQLTEDPATALEGLVDGMTHSTGMIPESPLPLGGAVRALLVNAARKGAQEGIEKLLAAEELAIELQRLIRPGVSRGRKIFSTLWGLGPELLDLVLKVFERRYNRSFRESLPAAVRTTQRARIIAVLDGRRGEAVLLSIGLLLTYRARFRRVEKLTAELQFLLEPLTRGERKELVSALFELSPIALRAFDDEPARARAMARDIFSGSAVEMTATLLEYAVRKGSTAGVLSLIRRLSAVDLLRVDRVLLRRHGLATSEWFERELPDGLGRRAAVAYAAGDRGAALACEIAISLDGESDVWLGEFFREGDGSHRKDVVRAYETVFAPARLADRIAESFHWRDAEILQDLVATGSVSPGKLLWFCVAGFGTDEEGIYELLAALSPSERREAVDEYRLVWLARAPWFERLVPRLFGHLVKRIWLECGGDSWYDIRELLLEEDDNPQRRVDRLYGHERSGWLAHRFGRLSREATAMERDIVAVRIRAEQLKDSRNVESFENSAIGADDPYLGYLIRVAELDCKTFRLMKHDIGDGLSGVAAAASGLLLTAVLPRFSHHLPLLMTTVGVASISARLTVKRLVKGAGYHKYEACADLFFGALDGATLFLSQAFRQALFRSGSRMASKMGIRTSLNTVLRRLRHVSVDAPHIGLDELLDSGPKPARTDGAVLLSDEQLLDVTTRVLLDDAFYFPSDGSKRSGQPPLSS